MPEQAQKTKKPPNHPKSPWTQAEKNILVPHIPKFRAEDKEGRKRLLGGTVIPQLYQLHPDLDARDKEDLKRKVKEWFSNTGRKKSTNSPLKLSSSKVPLATVIAVQEKQAIEDEVRKLSGAEPGTTEYIGCYRRGLKNVKDRLLPEKLEEYTKATKDWEEKGYPPEVQRKDADKKGHSLARSFEKLRYNRLGQRAVTLAFYLDSDGKLGVTVYDFNKELGEHDVLSFEQKYPDELAEFLNKVFDYGNYVIGIENGEIPEEVNIKKSKKRNTAEVLDRKDGYPIFKSSAGGDSLTEKKDIVRTFLNKNYALASGREKASAPFKALDRSHLDWADARYWPTDIVVSDPSRMNTAEIDKLLTFWRQRQETVPSSEIFRWSHVHTGPKTDRRRVPATYPKVDLAGADEDESINPDNGKAKGKRKKGKGKGKQKAKPSAETVEDSDQEDGRGEMGELPAIEQHTLTGTDLLTVRQPLQPEGQQTQPEGPPPQSERAPAAARDDFNIAPELRPDHYSNWFALPQDSGVGEYSKGIDFPQALQLGDAGDEKLGNEYRLVPRPPDCTSLQPAGPFNFWEPAADGQQDFMVQPYDFPPRDLLSGAHSNVTHTETDWNTLHLPPYDHMPATTMVETLRTDFIPTDISSADIPRATATDIEQAESVMRYDGPPNTMVHPQHTLPLPSYNRMPATTMVEKLGTDFIPTDISSADVPRATAADTPQTGSVMRSVPTDAASGPPPPPPQQWVSVDGYNFPLAKEATDSHTGPLPLSGKDRPPLQPADRPRPKPQPYIAYPTDDPDAFFMKNLNRKRPVPLPTATSSKAASAVPDTELETHPPVKKPRYDENVIQPKRSKRQPVPIQRPDYEPGPIAKMGNYKRP